jgi:hypothetical protein
MLGLASDKYSSATGVSLESPVDNSAHVGQLLAPPDPAHSSASISMTRNGKGTCNPSYLAAGSVRMNYDRPLTFSSEERSTFWNFILMSIQESG